MAEQVARWYVVHTYSGFENKAKQALEERVSRMELGHKIEEVLIPAEEVVELHKGKRKTSKRKFFPGYILVKMVLDEETFQMVKDTPKITGFVGGSTNPPFIPEDEARRLAEMIAAESAIPKSKEQFERGEIIRVIDGPFTGFNGIVDEVKQDKGKVRVLVSIFGRQTPVELDFIQVEKS